MASFAPPDHVQPERILGYMGACLLVHMTALPNLAHVFPALKRLSPEQNTDARNRCVSAGHALVMLALTLVYWLRINPGFRLPYREHPFASRQFDYMVGYLVFDALYLLRVAPGPLDGATLAHHVLGCAALLAAHWPGDGPSSFYLMLIFLAEASTPLMHAGIVVKDATKKTPVAILGVFTVVFFFSRVLLAPFALWHLWSHREAWHRQGLLWLELAAVAFFLVLNWFWFHRIVRLAMKNAGGEKSKE